MAWVFTVTAKAVGQRKSRQCAARWPRSRHGAKRTATLHCPSRPVLCSMRCLLPSYLVCPFFSMPRPPASSESSCARRCNSLLGDRTAVCDGLQAFVRRTTAACPHLCLVHGWAHGGDCKKCCGRPHMRPRGTASARQPQCGFVRYEMLCDRTQARFVVGSVPLNENKLGSYAISLA